MSLLDNLRRLLRLDSYLKAEAQIYNEIEELNRQNGDWQTILNQESIWLFVSSLGVWSIPSSPLASHRLMVAALLLVAFSARIEWRKGDIKESFPKCIDRIETKIASSNLSEKTKESMLYKLGETKARITGKSAYKNTWIFIICWFYYSVCFCFFADAVIVSIRDRLLESLQ